MEDVKRILKEVLNDPELKRELSIQLIITVQALEGIETTYEQAAKAYDGGKLQGGVVNDYA